MTDFSFANLNDQELEKLYGDIYKELYRRAIEAAKNSPPLNEEEINELKKSKFVAVTQYKKRVGISLIKAKAAVEYHERNHQRIQP